MNYATPGSRFVAYLVDVVVLTAAIFVVNMLLSIVGLVNPTAQNNLVGLIVALLYVVVYQAKTGQTLGKKVMNIKVVTEDGKTPDMVKFFLREVIGKALSSIILGIGYLMILWDSKRQGLHDKIAKTYVVKA